MWIELNWIFWAHVLYRFWNKCDLVSAFSYSWGLHNCFHTAMRWNGFLYTYLCICVWHRLYNSNSCVVSLSWRGSWLLCSVIIQRLWLLSRLISIERWRARCNRQKTRCKLWLSQPTRWVNASCEVNQHGCLSKHHGRHWVKTFSLPSL